MIRGSINVGEEEGVVRGCGREGDREGELALDRRTGGDHGQVLGSDDSAPGAVSG